MSVKLFKVGDKVRVREGLKSCRSYDTVFFANKILSLKNTKLTIKEVHIFFYYRVEEVDLVFFDEMLQPISSSTVPPTSKNI